MLHVDYKVEYGEIVYKQRSDNEVYTLKIHWANALCAFIHHYNDEKGDKWCTLINFFNNEQHIKNIEKSEESSGDPLYWIEGDIESIKLNIFYKEARTLLKHFTKGGHKVLCYYENPKNQK